MMNKTFLLLQRSVDFVLSNEIDPLRVLVAAFMRRCGRKMKKPRYPKKGLLKSANVTLLVIIDVTFNSSRENRHRNSTFAF
jgi:hypothetical protein